MFIVPGVLNDFARSPDHCQPIAGPRLCGSRCQKAPQRWSEQKANDWYAKQPWLVGANFVPSDAINQMEMFQKATFDPALIDEPYRVHETELIRDLTGRGEPLSAEEKKSLLESISGYAVNAAPRFIGLISRGVSRIRPCRHVSAPDLRSLNYRRFSA